MKNQANSLPSATVPFLHEKQIEHEANLLLDEYALKFGAVSIGELRERYTETAERFSPVANRR